MNRKPKIVLDTNVLLISISSRSEEHWVFQKLVTEEFDLVITNEILAEYEEVISQKYSVDVANDIVRALLFLPNVSRSEVYYQWSLIAEDEDDNKFVDCAVSANADFLVTNDKHFRQLKDITFPFIRILNIKEFKKLLP